MHRRTHSGASSAANTESAMSLHSSHGLVRSLVDSPGSSDSEDSYESDEHEHEHEHESRHGGASGFYSSDAFGGLSDVSSCVFAHTNQDQAIVLPLHRQQSNASGRDGDNSNVPVPVPVPVPATIENKYMISRATGNPTHPHQYQYQQQYQHRYTSTDSALDAENSWQNKLQKENKKPGQDSDCMISRQSTFESTSTFQSDTPLSVRSSGISPARSRISLDDIDEHEHSRHSSSSNVNNSVKSTAPLVLGASRTQEAAGNQQQRNPTSSNTLVLTSDGNRMENAKNAVLKNILSTVQLRPRLLPFSPMLSKEPNIPTQALVDPVINAASFAKHAPMAGYLSKLGSSVSEYKRRFFVLKPTTCLYYFLSPNDEEPRGCIDLDGFVDPSDKSGMGGLKINSLGSLPDGRFRFECVFPLETKERDGPQTRKILLEARNEEVGKEWMHALTVERLSYSKASEQLLKDQVNELEKEMELMEKRLEELKLVEKDLEGAMEDSNLWQERSDKMNSAMYLLKRYLTTSPSDTEKTGSSGDYDLSDSIANNNDKISLSISKEEKELDDAELPGTHLASLTNACRGIKENLRLTSIETSTALEDLKASDENMKATEARMAKAEKYVCKLWEENCGARESLRQKKSEKKVLVKEVRSLMEKSSRDSDELSRLEDENTLLKKQLEEAWAGKNKRNDKAPNKVQNRRKLSTPEKKLLFDLEEHVNTSLVQHEYLLHHDDQIESCPRMKIMTEVDPKSVTMSAKMSNTSVDVSKSSILPHKLYEAREGDSSSDDGIDEDDSESEEKELPKRTLSPLRPKQLSLMDQAAMDEAKAEKNGKLTERLNSPSAFSLTSANLEAFDHHVKGQTGSLVPGRVNLMDISAETGNDVSECERCHPLKRLGADDCTSGPSDSSLKYLVTDNGKATSKLVCPLKDVQQSSPASKQGRGQVYSLTFYTPKIGLQFQKVPSNSRQSGLLSEAMTADVSEKNGESAVATSRTEAELRLIASLSNPHNAPKGNDHLKDQSCPVLLPKHNVLVCGFNGFDNTSGNRKPSLGARLVGFDGMSIERGPWTFEAVRRGIKARGRPLTLTFRDDHLTTEQRAILTKAAHDVEQTTNQPPRHHGHFNVPATINAITKSANFIAKSPSFSDVSRDVQSHDDSTTITDYSRSSENWRTFSDNGSSSAFSSRFSPLVAGLMTGYKKKGEAPFTPEYFRRSTDSLNSTPHHRQFKAGLL